MTRSNFGLPYICFYLWMKKIMQKAMASVLYKQGWSQLTLYWNWSRFLIFLPIVDSLPLLGVIKIVCIWLLEFFLMQNLCRKRRQTAGILKTFIGTFPCHVLQRRYKTMTYTKTNTVAPSSNVSWHKSATYRMISLCVYSQVNGVQ